MTVMIKFRDLLKKLIIYLFPINSYLTGYKYFHLINISNFLLIILLQTSITID